MSAATALKAAATGNASSIKDMKPKDQVKFMLEQNKHVIAQALPKHMNPERLLRVAITSVTSNPKLLECYVPTLIGGIIQCSQMGLEPNTVLGHAYLIPFKNKKMNRKDAQVIIGYKGLIDLARRSGQIISIAAHAVYSADTFEYEYGLTEKLRHIPAEGDRGSITHFYAVAHMKDGGHAFEVMTASAVLKIRNSSQGRDNDVWSDHFEEMGRKTAIRRLAKYLPLSVELATAVALEDVTERGETQGLDSVLTGEFTVHGDDEPQNINQTNGDTSMNVNQETGETSSLLDDVKRICADAVKIADNDTAWLRLDDAKVMLNEMSDENKALAVVEIDAAENKLKARK